MKVLNRNERNNNAFSNLTSNQKLSYFPIRMLAMQRRNRKTSHSLIVHPQIWLATVKKYPQMMIPCKLADRYFCQKTNVAMYAVMNKIQCTPNFAQQLEQLFQTRAHAIDQMKGFEKMMVLKSENNPNEYIVFTLWQSENDFKNWLKSSAFIEGHQRAFTLMAQANEKPMESIIEKYRVIAL